MGTRVEKTESEVDLLRWENNELKEQLLEIKTYGMKYNSTWNWHLWNKIPQRPPVNGKTWSQT